MIRLGSPNARYMLKRYLDLSTTRDQAYVLTKDAMDAAYVIASKKMTAIFYRGFSAAGSMSPMQRRIDAGSEVGAGFMRFMPARGANMRESHLRALGAAYRQSRQQSCARVTHTIRYYGV